MPDEAVRNADHPIPPDHIRHSLCRCIPRERPPNPRIQPQDIVDAPFDDDAILEKVLADKRIPEEGRVIPGEGRGPFLPAVIAGRIQFQPRHRKPTYFE